MSQIDRSRKKVVKSSSAARPGRLNFNVLRNGETQGEKKNTRPNFIFQEYGH